jgi:hypothetical protein
VNDQQQRRKKDEGSMAEKREKKARRAKSQDDSAEIVSCKAVMVHEPNSQVYAGTSKLEGIRVVEGTHGRRWLEENEWG